MALPIKPSDTQEGCNPISSNCVIWQGPDIPCINLCNGDSVSDVVAKLAEKLCAISDQLDISLIDYSCFDPVYPTPDNFRDLVQLIINRVCALENPTEDPNKATALCPDDCLVNVATCLQTTDYLGNLITQLPLKDYVILIANNICTILNTISTIDGEIGDIKTRLDYIEANCCTQTVPVVPTASCISGVAGMSIINFVTQLETAFCDLKDTIGTSTAITTAIGFQCTGLDGEAPLSYPELTMSAIPGWIGSANYDSLADAVTNMWITICDMRGAITSLSAQLAACCVPSCDDISWNFTAGGIIAGKEIGLYFSGSVPSNFGYCAPATTAPVLITDAINRSYTFNEDVIGGINGTTVISLDLTTPGTPFPAFEQSIFYTIAISLTVCDTTTGLTCPSVRTFTLENSSWCDQLAASSSSPAPGQIDISWTTSLLPGTSYDVRLYNITAGNVEVDNDLSNTTGTSTFIGLTTGNLYQAKITTKQGIYRKECTVASIVCG